MDFHKMIIARPTFPKPRRRRLQFSLGTLLVLMFLAENVATGIGPAAGWDELLARHKQLLKNVEDLKDYTCVLHMQEPTDDGQTLSSVMTLKVRHHPFSVYARFHRPDRDAEFLSVAGRNEGRLLVSGSPHGDRLPNVWLPPANRIARLGGIRPFTQVDMRSVLLRAIDLLEKTAPPEGGKLEWRKNAKLNGRVCSLFRLELASGDGKDRVWTDLFIDDERQLPVRFAIWKLSAGEKDRPTLVEEYTFTRLQTNVGLTDEDFSQTNPLYFFDRRGVPAPGEESKDESATGRLGGKDGLTPKAR